MTGWLVGCLAGQGIKFIHLWKEEVRWFWVVSSTSCLRLKASTHSERGRLSSDPKDSRRERSVDFEIERFSRPGTIPRSAPRRLGGEQVIWKSSESAEWKQTGTTLPGSHSAAWPHLLPPGSFEHFPPNWTSLRWKSDSQRATSAHKLLRTCVGVQF